MESYGGKRMSMNTSLKNARIFDDDSWDAESYGFIVKKEPVDEQPEKLGNESPTHFREEPAKEIIQCKIKKEDKGDVEEEVNKFLSKIRNESDNLFPNLGKEIKKEEGKETEIKKGERMEREIKKEPVETVPQLESGEPDYIRTPIKSEFIRDETNPSPFNKELFKNFSLDSPQSIITDSKIPKETKTSVARTVFKQEYSEPSSGNTSENSSDCEQLNKTSVKDRLGPKVEDDDRCDANRIPVKRRLGPKIGHDDVPSKKYRSSTREYETNPDVLDRRQKQIDYGKNTLGYDQYIAKVSRFERKQNDPQTPNKYLKYSRRGWDGLIKQWRLRLHQYDPKDG